MADIEIHRVSGLLPLIVELCIPAFVSNSPGCPLSICDYYFLSTILFSYSFVNWRYIFSTISRSIRSDPFDPLDPSSLAPSRGSCRSCSPPRYWSNPWRALKCRVDKVAVSAVAAAGKDGDGTHDHCLARNSSWSCSRYWSSGRWDSWIWATWRRPKSDNKIKNVRPCTVKTRKLGNAS